ncbi:trimethylamine---corrinoid protein Co-methyltransferase [Dethiosulfatibacter aminovorans DSM 17477]|uniref:Trimethylamine---corrinoid protein Co-methyltransferase n=1 Tax=Dethiosulfatibacter aminovorans DSM 17477 TaxID=1121476 RepID=A0A1M6G2R7_9FIRM|nr:trimethylamine methyltransferase family protein [Dethiosulfatibacter aminovorans]SHJ04265.1 trimethylamine---corrinoid protein Co-methyltransferase [Dethiosulfatibacter aminovorans DSM 17477]
MSSLRIKNEAIQKLHENTIWILENVGIEFKHPEVIDIFKARGFKTENGKVFMTQKDIDKYTKHCPSSFEIKGLKSSVTMGSGPVFSGPSGALRLLKGREGKNLTSKDFIDVQKLNDTSKATDMTNSNLFEVEDIPFENNALVKTALSLWVTGKPIVGFASNKKETLASIQLAKEFYNNEFKYYILGIANVLSPLCFDGDSLDSILAYVEYEQPVCISCCSMPGLSSPVTIAGTLVQNNAEIMAGIILTQIIKPGTPVLYGNTSFASDMRYAGPAIGGIESSSFIPYIKGLADFYGIPCRAGGAFTDSKEVDWQSGAESSISLYTTVINDIDLIYHSCGELDSLNMFSYEKFLLDEQIIMMLKKMHDSYALNDEFCLESIKRTGPGGNYLFELETTMMFKKELMIPEYFQREMFDNWIMNGKPDIVETAANQIQNRIESYRRHELTEKQNSLLYPIVNKYIKE